MKTTFILICYVLGCLYMGISGFLLFFSPPRYFKFLTRFIVLGEKPAVNPGWNSMQARIAGLLIGVFSLVALALPIYWYLGSEDKSQRPLSTDALAPDTSWGLLVGLAFLIAYSLAMVIKPRSLLSWHARQSPLANLNKVSRRGLLYVRVLGAVIMLMSILGIWRALR